MGGLVSGEGVKDSPRVIVQRQGALFLADAPFTVGRRRILIGLCFNIVLLFLLRL